MKIGQAQRGNAGWRTSLRMPSLQEKNSYKKK
jgi:hypothetical protein